MSTNVQAIDVEAINKVAKRLVENFHSFTKHSPKMLRDSMMMSYCKAIDDLFQAMDSCKIENPIKLKEESPVHLLDSSGHAL